MKKFAFLLTFFSLAATAQNTVIDISGNNTSSDYKTYDKAFSISSGKAVDVKMARYCYFSSTITGTGMLNLYAGGERCYLGTEKGKAWPNWTNYKGDIHIWPFKENSSSAGFYGVVLAHGGKSSSAENALDDAKSGKVNPSMANNKVTLHKGATICCEANTSGAGFRIGELQTEPGSTLQGYMKTGRAAYYLIGGLGTDATLAGTIAPSNYNDATLLGIVKEGKGTCRITGNDNYLSGALRVMEGRVLVDNDTAQARSKKMRGALGARPSDAEAIAYVFEKGVLGGKGSIGGTVDNYGTIEPGSDSIGLLTIRNYQTPSKDANLLVRPASVLRFKIASADSYDQIAVSGTLKYQNMKQDFTTSDQMPRIELVLKAPVSNSSVSDGSVSDGSMLEGSVSEGSVLEGSVSDGSVLEGLPFELGTEFVLLTAKSKAGDWHFDLQKPERHTWALQERTAGGQYQLVLKLVSLEDDDDPDHPDNPDNPDVTGQMGPFYDDGIDDQTDTKTLRYYAAKNGKNVGVALATYKGYESDRNEGGRQFNMMVAENEMKMDALQPSKGQFSYGGADQLVSFAQKNGMAVRGHCLVWHMQQPSWLSSDGKKNDMNWSRAEALQIMKDHITNVVKHFKGKVVEWDVVNECLDDDQSVIRSNPDTYTLRQTVWQRAIGDDYIDSAFVFAHRADPSAVLYLNDYDVELQGKAKAVAFYNLAMRLKRQGIPIGGVGLQCHFSVGEVDSVKLESTVRRFGEEGMKCIITELDMGIPSTSEKDLLEQARNYRVVTDIVLNNDNCPSMVIWGLKDNDSWRNVSSPLLYTAGLAKKKAWYAVRSALRHRAIEKEKAGVETFGSRQIIPATATYDLSGRRADGRFLKSGIYVRGGTKVYVK